METLIPHKCTNEPLILASASPRRSYLLEQAGLEFQVIVSDADETCPAGASPRECAAMLSEKKALAVAESHPGHWVLGADTIVVTDGRILGKPSGMEEARDMITMLGGRTHQVLTGFSIFHVDKGVRHTEVISTQVTFKSLSPDEIEWYLSTGEPFDKAGAYAIQGIGTFLVKSISGSYTNVVGLPVCEVIEFFMAQGVIMRTSENDG
ncbi:septum formation protein [Desulfatibacillum alkenivorans DSM 16219]|jgi:septum formation protein|uniref:dTTP/UTP pyrophosphatase n=1 Tax=Desulfatibacillum alkenivorans DSM 16219 TaxID=1121393 RepID=A0A1M6T373_9BACT|nr:Maf family protein [Desulfatibacillum alkenivorans]SHK51435.1 septum formation protein [Desulfatibacillum alkenivorans DSM 16219]